MRRASVRFLSIVACSLLLTSGLLDSRVHAQAPVWQPAKTWVFVVGVLEFEDSESLPSFPKQKRRDAMLVRYFKGQGIADSHIVYLADSAATTHAIHAALTAQLAKTRPGDTLFLYYSGHGYEGDAGDVYFASYDASDATPGWSVSSLVDTVDAGFAGSRTLLTADCCYSGALVKAIRSRRRRVSHACLASSQAGELSTGNWTFTDCLLDGFEGSPGVDENGDGEITLGELATYTEQDMLEGEQQRAVFSTSRGFPADLTIAYAAPRGGRRVGERVNVTSDGDVYAARIVEERAGRVKVHYIGYDRSEDEWVGDDQLIARKRAALQTGAAAEVEWNGAWYRATVLRAKDAVYLVHYTGYSSEWDEWVNSTRIRALK